MLKTQGFCLGRLCCAKFPGDSSWLLRPIFTIRSTLDFRVALSTKLSIWTGLLQACWRGGGCFNFKYKCQNEVKTLLSELYRVLFLSALILYCCGAWATIEVRLQMVCAFIDTFCKYTTCVMGSLKWSSLMLLVGGWLRWPGDGSWSRLTALLLGDCWECVLIPD
jgi:hypothetical protein